MAAAGTLNTDHVIDAPVTSLDLVTESEGLDLLRTVESHGTRIGRHVKRHAPTLPRVPRWITWFALTVALGFLGWIIYLATDIKSIVTTHHYDVAWLGYDVLECSMVAVAGFAAWKHQRSTTIFTAICAMMFAIDGWFDVWTSPRGSVFGAVLFAVCLEFPLVAIFTFATIHGERVKNRLA